jgi:hypothetical protein
LVDGEASAAQLAELRPHLRNCAACRADLRALHRGSAALGGVFPVSLVAGAGVAHHDAVGWMTRVHDAIAAQFHERVVGSMLRIQSAAEVLSAGKVTAVAASAAALAGGGIAVAGNVAASDSGSPRAAHIAPAVVRRTQVAARIAPPPAAAPPPRAAVPVRVTHAAPKVHPKPAAAPRAHEFAVVAPSEPVVHQKQPASAGSTSQEFAP